jgi:hypothetical protein
MAASAPGVLAVSDLTNMTIHGATAGNGVVLSGVRFDADPLTGAFEQVNAGTLSVGSGSDPVGGSAIVATSLSGDVHFTSLVASGALSGVSVTGTGPFGGSTGMRIGVQAGSIRAQAGDGLRVVNASIASSGLNFERLDAVGGMNGILLQSAPGGAVVVTGNGTPGSGGTIANTAEGVVATGSGPVDLTRMNLINANTAEGGGIGVCDGLVTSGCKGAVRIVQGAVALRHVTIDGAAENGLFGSGLTSLVVDNSSLGTWNPRRRSLRKRKRHQQLSDRVERQSQRLHFEFLCDQPGARGARHADAHEHDREEPGIGGDLERRHGCDAEQCELQNGRRGLDVRAHARDSGNRRTLPRCGRLVHA